MGNLAALMFLEQEFPWLRTHDSVRGSDVVNQLNDLHKSLIEEIDRDYE